jgi:hypothetical protein
MAWRASTTSWSPSVASGAASAPRAAHSKLLKRVFEIDLEHCPNCGGEPKIIAAILEPWNSR